MEFEIRQDDLMGPEIAELLQRHLEHAAMHSPRESIHALDLERLRVPGITFWTSWSGPTLVGCAALKSLAPDHGEIKSMHTAQAHRGKGVAAGLLTHLLDEAKARGYQRVSLETGSMDGFVAARALYARFGFTRCAPFGEYGDDPNSVCMTLDLGVTDCDLEHLREVIVVAAQARSHGNHPFGALLVDEAGVVRLRGENAVVTSRDCTSHAEANLVREASRLFTPEQLSRFTLYASTEPCAMCAGAIHWSQIGRLVFALSAADLQTMIGPSPDHLRMPCREVFDRRGRPMVVVGPVAALEPEARAVHENHWPAPPVDAR